MTAHLGRARSVALNGLLGRVIDVEAHLGQGLPAFTVGGLPDIATRQAPDRVRAAATSLGLHLSQHRITVNLSPAGIPKHGTGFDLPIAVAVLAAREVISAEAVRDVCHLGELGLDGSVRPVHGVLPAVLAAARDGVHRVMVPRDNAVEAGLVDGVEVWPVASLSDVVAGYTAISEGAPWPFDPPPPGTELAAEHRLDLADVCGQSQAREALEVAAAGGHHMLMSGPPGTGKTMLAERLVTILPPLTPEQALDVQAIRSLSTVPGSVSGLPRLAPFEAPHHSASTAALVGGGAGNVTPGAISRAHHGVLFLDEAPEFAPHVLQALRQPVESGRVVISRVRAVVEFPARFQLVLAANPCPCGNGVGKAVACTCSPHTMRRYAGRLGGPLTDRIDIQVHVPAARAGDLAAGPGESSSVVAQRVQAAREVQARRWKVGGYELNAHVPGGVLRAAPWRLPHRSTRGLDLRLDRGTLTLRGYDRVLRVAWTKADLAGRVMPSAEDVETALAMRSEAVAA